MTDPDQLHICICCSPVRYAWDLLQGTVSALEHGFPRAA